MDLMSTPRRPAPTFLERCSRGESYKVLRAWSLGLLQLLATAAEMIARAVHLVCEGGVTVAFLITRFCHGVYQASQLFAYGISPTTHP